MIEKERKVGKKTLVRKTRGKGIEYCLRIGAHPIYMTGFRVPVGTVLPDMIVDPSFEKIDKLIQGG